MRRGKIRFLLVALLVASGLWFASGEARAETLTLYVGGSKCDVTLAGFTSSTTIASYTYTYNTTTTISNIDLEVPAEITLNSSNVKVYFSPDPLTSWTPASFELFAPGVGDSGTKLGTGDMRYGVLKVNASSKGFPLKFHILIEITGQNKTLSASPQVMLLKSGNGSVWASGSISAPTLSSKPMPTVSLSADNTSLSPTQCTFLRWSSTNANFVVIEPIGLVTPNDVGSREVCLDTTTTFKITAIGEAGASETAQVTVNVATMPFPAIEVARQTIEKKDALGNITGNITFYFKNGLPACSCVTDIGDQILDFPCQDLPENCRSAFQDPLLVCIPFPGKTKEELQASCANGENCSVVPATCSVQPVGCFARCDTLEYLTLDTTIEVGPHSCTCTTSKIRLLNGTYKTITSCSGTPCP